MKKIFFVLFVLCFALVGVNVCFADTTSQLSPVGNGFYQDWSGSGYTVISEGMGSPSCTSGNYINTSGPNKHSSFTIDLSSIPDGSSIASVNVLAADRSYSSGNDGGTYAAFVRLNGSDGVDSSIYTTSYGSGDCSGSRNDSFSAGGVTKDDTTTLEIGVVKLGSSNPAKYSVVVGAMAAIITYTPPATPVDGGWTAWDPVDSSCGLSYTQTRSCTNPTPADGGADCSLLDGGNTSRTVTNDACVVAPPRQGGGQYIGTLTQTQAQLQLQSQPQPQLVGQVLGVSVFKFNNDLWYGKNHNDVMELHKKLQTEIGYVGPVSIYFRKLTENAVREYQTAHNLVPDGIVGPLTRAELNK